MNVGDTVRLNGAGRICNQAWKGVSLDVQETYVVEAFREPRVVFLCGVYWPTVYGLRAGYHESYLEVVPSAYTNPPLTMLSDPKDDISPAPAGVGGGAYLVCCGSYGVHRRHGCPVARLEEKAAASPWSVLLGGKL